MRGGYAFMGIWLATVEWPLLIDHPEPWPLFEGVVTCVLTAMSVLAFLGLRYPVRLLPILLFECAWKIIWLSAVAVPGILSGALDEDTREVAVNCALVVVVLAVLPWRFIGQRYVMEKGDRWRP